MCGNGSNNESVHVLCSPCWQAINEWCVNRYIDANIKEESMQKRTIISIMVMIALLLCQAPVMAGEMDMLVDKLVDKGVLTKKDGDLILSVQKSEKDKTNKEIISSLAMPEFIKNTKFKGDFRLRYEYSDRENGEENRNRGRYRFRLGGVTKVNDKVEVGYGLASGSADPRSTNQTFTNSFETPDIRLDYAYASYKPFEWLRLVGGQFENPLWMPSGWMWDSDIRPQGVSASMNRTVGDVELFMNNGFWIIDEIANSNQDPMMFVLQPGYKIKLGEKAYFKNAFAYYNFVDVKGSVLDYTAKTNTLDNKTLKYDYEPVVVSGELGFNTGIAPMPFAALYGEYIKNTASSVKEDTGYTAGIKFGHEKIKEPGQWQATAYYEKLEKDAWLDTFPDSDAYGGATDIKSYVVKAGYGLMKNVEFNTAYYHSKKISGPSNDENVLQADLLFRF